ncbi:peptidylprolyl isomerase [Arcicella aquatica]|uniref:Peptidylprolyl isomerase n=1 Tax=Arcicella aquatica TaxID=217141 RepID=A0ABU5QL21_9BACT|nr:peptidylprolyl isomerase [Arcicella aquatica]MEA5257404.1 peptidylprolyl isomerase [Arcicella aquatica]
MNKSLTRIYRLIALILITVTTAEAQNENYALKIGNRTINSKEFSQTFQKLTQSDSVRKDNQKEFINNYINYKLIVYAAERMGKDTTRAFREEIETYRKELASPYLVDKLILEKLIQESYERMREEIRVAQIFIPLAKNASPADTMVAYNELKSLRARISKGESFDQLAKTYSKDTYSAAKGGDLGFLSVLENNYTFETAAYNTPKGEMSNPFRTNKGFHLIKVLDRHSFRGKVKLAHILVSLSPTASSEEATKAKKKIDEAYEYLKRNEPFEGVCRVFSEDTRTKDNGGVMNRFWDAGTLIDQKIVETVFALKEKNDYTQPIQTSLGWHIFRLVEKKSLPKYDEMAPFIRQKITADASRNIIIKNNLVKRLQKDNNFQEILSVKQEAIENFYKDRIGTEDYLAKALFTINQTSSSVKDFYSFVTKHQRQLAKLKALDEKTPQDWYDLFVENQNLRYEESNLEIKFPEFRADIQEYREGILQKQMLNDNVYEKSLDSLAQVKFYNQHIDQYQYTHRVLAKVITSDRKETLEQAKTLLAKTPYPMNRRFPDIYFEKDKSVLSSDAQKMLYDLNIILLKNRDYIVEVTGNSDPEEAENISAERAKKSVNYLINSGITPMRIIEKDDGKYKPISKTDRSKNSRVGIRFLSDSMEDVVKRFNALKPNSLTAEEGFFKKDENEYLKDVEWTVGEKNLNLKGRFVSINILKVEEPRTKTFKEARGQITRDYQKQLLENWINQLKSKYPVTVNENEIQKVIN